MENVRQIVESGELSPGQTPLVLGKIGRVPNQCGVFQTGRFEFPNIFATLARPPANEAAIRAVSGSDPVRNDRWRALCLSAYRVAGHVDERYGSDKPLTLAA